MTGGWVLAGIFGASLALTQAPAPQPGQQGQQPQGQQAAPRFRSSVDIVSVAAVVRDRKGRFVKDLSQKDFEIVEAGRPRPILDFRAELDGPVKVAVVMDISGSMRMGQRTADARQAASHIFSSLSGSDQAAVFSFDTMLSEVQGFTSDRGKLEAAVKDVDPPFGQTSLYDAIADTARLVAAASATGSRKLPQRSAVIVITDGVDTRSRLQPNEVAVVASNIDVPVYVVTVVSTVDDPRKNEDERDAALASDLQELARRTGGELFITSAPAHASTAARQMISELRHQYVLAFEASNRSGWRPLEIRTRQNSLVVRARSGYSGGERSTDGGSRREGGA